MGYETGSAPFVAHRAAFVDVDRALVAADTLGGLLAHLLPDRRPGRAEPGVGPLSTARAALHRLARSGAPRQERYREGFRLLAGLPVGTVAAAGREWFAAAARQPGFFHEPVLAELRDHRDAGDLVVLVSGSFAACLSPIARHVGADAVLGTVPEARAGTYTGGIATLLVGPAKGAAVRRWMAENGVAPMHCTAYGSAAADLSMLLQVAHPVVVGDDPVLTDHARRPNWRRLPAASRLPAAG
jgi:HAD superfamily hydrolase (TIGR01490 family)